MPQFSRSESGCFLPARSERLSACPASAHEPFQPNTSVGCEETCGDCLHGEHCPDIPRRCHHLRFFRLAESVPSCRARLQCCLCGSTCHEGPSTSGNWREWLRRVRRTLSTVLVESR